MRLFTVSSVIMSLNYIRATTLGAVAYLMLVPSSVVAETGTQGKGSYNLFDPTPTVLLRELSTDRPDTTESPFTVDAGHFQFETTLLGYSRSHTDSAGTTTKAYEYGTTNLRIGLTNAIELSLIYAPYGMMRVSSPDPTLAGRFSGSGDLTVRTKFNFWGNDSFQKAGETALGLLPFVNIPTNKGNGISSDFVQGGVILPFAIKLTDKLDLGINGGVQWMHNDDMPGYHKEWIVTGSFGYDWSEVVSTYYEIAANFSTPQGDAIQLGTGISYKIGKNLQWDAGINFGITTAAPRLNPFMGVSARF